MSRADAARPDDDDESTPGSAIPGAWARPASAFADEASVVRPERANAGGSRAVSLIVLSVLAVGAAAFAWGVTVALQQLDEETHLVASNGEPASGAKASVGGAREAEPPPVPDADPSFPALPDPNAPADAPAPEASADARAPDVDDESLQELDIDIPAPKLLRLARGDNDDERERKRKRYKRQLKKKQQLARQQAASARKGAKAPAAKAVASAKPAEASAPAPTAASLTREAEQLFAQGKLDDARATAERALGLSRGYPRAHRALAVICAKQGDTACARQGYETYLRLAPGAPDAPDVRRILGM